MFASGLFEETLLENEVSGLHFYSMNRSQHVMQIVQQLSLNRRSKNEGKKRFAGRAIQTSLRSGN